MERGVASDTIYALSSGPGPAAVAVMRLSGPAAAPALLRLAGWSELPSARRAVCARLTDPDTGVRLDDALAIWFPAPRSYSGEDMVELHLHGGIAVIAAVADALGREPGLRMAEPGEFTRRAFGNGKLDLTEAEGIGDLVAAETEAQRRQALRQAEGALGRVYEQWRERLVATLAHLEAWIDFPDEEIPGEVAAAVDHDILGLRQEISQHLDDSRRGERLRQGLDIAIVGPPNAGKSSLLNLLARRDAAIVSEIAGTTRDVIEVALDLGGYPVVLADTAGIREAADRIEQEGVRRARRRAEAADLRIAIFDGRKRGDYEAARDLVDDTTIVVLNKLDLGAPTFDAPQDVLDCHAISVVSGDGVDGFLDALEGIVKARIGLTAQPALTRMRHREALQDCLEALDRCQGAAFAELRAEDLRLAARALGRITGRVDVEELLDVIFRDFCIGK